MAEGAHWVRREVARCQDSRRHGAFLLAGQPSQTQHHDYGHRGAVTPDEDGQRWEEQRR